MQPEGPVKFYRKNEEYGFMSNFYEAPFVMEEVQYKTN